VATLDRLSGGRFLFGVGVGWNEEELANHRPIPWAQRYRAIGECVAALKALWCEEEAEFHGEFYDFDPVWLFPKPVQRPHPPILCGMAGRLGMSCAVTWADAWMPMDIALGNVAKGIARFRDAEATAGRGPGQITVVAWGDPPLKRLLQYRELGVDQTVLGAGRASWDVASTTIPFLDRYAACVHEVA
jgi:alkanesulfonate monooxygenase SsuD/methylene tetrahydromethanopterin reductase-like flavin-dependent oxidoreductase (luciferase family)